MIGANEFGEGGVGGEVGDDEGRGDGLAVVAPHAGDFVVVDEDLLDLGAVADLAAATLEHLAQVLGEGADAAFEFGHHCVDRHAKPPTVVLKSRRARIGFSGLLQVIEDYVDELDNATG